MLLATKLNPPQLAEARTWWAKAAAAGHTEAQANLGKLLAMADPPELAEARTWWAKAAAAGRADARDLLKQFRDG